MAYSLMNSYAGESLLSGFNWFNGADPSHGYVAYQSQSNAQSMGLYSVDESTGVVRLGVDHKNKYSLDQGRPSIRLESKEAYNHGLFIADFLHMPPSQCGLWPAFWSYGNDWPNGGEIDIIEGVNTAHTNIMSAHTSSGCTQSPALSKLFAGEQRNTECAVGNDNIGCGFNPPASDTASYGDGFNAVNGGVYAMKWDSDYISLWHFPRGSIPADIEAKKPEPDNWGLPQAVFGGSSCDVDTYWKNMNIVININFCGDYGNGVWGKTDTCTDFAPTCSEYVANNPEAFANAYWDVRYIDAYEFNADGNNTTTTTSSAPAAGEPTTTTIMTHLSTKTVTVNGTPTAINATVPITSTFITTPSAGNSNGPHANATVVAPFVTPTPIKPIATKTPTNPVNIGDFSYLGCFDSSSKFKTFHQAADSKGMTLEKCVALCKGKKFAGVFDTKCFCADEMDSDTRATMSEQMCNSACPGDDMEFCGGVIEHHGNKDHPGPSSDAAHGSGSLSAASSTAASSAAPSSHKSHASKPVPFQPNNSTKFMASRRFHHLRRESPSTYALTVYGSVSHEKPQAPPPAMGPGHNKTSTDVVTSTHVAEPHHLQTASPTDVVTSVSVVTVFPIPASQDTSEQVATTFLTKVVTDCDCDEEEMTTTPVTKVTVPVMETVTDCPEEEATQTSEVTSTPTLVMPTLVPWNTTMAPINPPPFSEPAKPLPTPSSALPSPPSPPPASSAAPVERPVETTIQPSVVTVSAASDPIGEVKMSTLLGLVVFVAIIMF